MTERSRSRSSEAGYGYGYGQGRRGQGLDPGFREAEGLRAKAAKPKPGAKKVVQKRNSREDGKQSKTFHDPYQLIDPNEPVNHKVIPHADERNEPEEEPPQERLGPRRPLPPNNGRSGSPRKHDMVGRRSRSRSRSCSVYSYYSYGSYSFSSGWSSPSPRRIRNSRSPSPGWQSHLDARPRDVASGPPPPPAGPPPGSWSQPEAPSTSSSRQPQYSPHPGPLPLQTAPWDYRGHPPASHYPPPPGRMQHPPPFYGVYPPAHVHFQGAGFPAPPPGYGPARLNRELGYGQLEARARFLQRQGRRKGIRTDPVAERDGSKTPKRTKKKRRKNHRPKSPGEPPPKWGDTWEEPRSSNGLKLIHEVAPKDLKWKVVLSDESRRSFASFMPSPVPTAQLGNFFKTIYGNTEWEQPEGPQGLLPRKTVWMVKRGCKCPYRYGGVTIHPQEFPEWMTELLRTYMPYCGKTEDEWPDSCNVNLYEDGSHAVGWHTDDETLFQSLHQDVAIVSLSLGQPRKFDIRKNWPEDGEKVQDRLHLGNGALATMEGMLQKHYMHRIAREDESLGPRINLTWRWIKKHAQVCPKSHA